MAGQPIVPRSIVNPVGETARINRTVTAVVDALDEVEGWLLERFNAIPVNSILANSLWVNSYRYEYQISTIELQRLVDDLLIRLGIIPTDYVVQQTVGAYEAGTNLAVTNLANISEDYTRNITSVLLSQPYQTRAALVGARVFEEMKGFQGETGRELSRILFGAVQDGLNPLEASRTIKDRFDISARRAETIARTEITGALRRGRWDEAQDAQDRLGIRTKMMWISALSPTTRLWHATRHGTAYTIQEVREFYTERGDAVNCKCTQVETLVDEQGNPINNRVVLRLKKQKDQYFGDE